MKKSKYVYGILIVIFIACMMSLSYIEPKSSKEPIKWPDFVMVNEKCYIFTGDYASKNDIGERIGSIMRNPPNETCKYQAQNFEASELKKGTEIYSTSNGTDIIAVIEGKYKLYRVVSEEEFHNLLQ